MSIAALSNVDEQSSLSQAMLQLANVEEKLSKLHNKMADSDFYLFSELINDYIGILQAIKVSTFRWMCKSLIVQKKI